MKPLAILALLVFGLSAGCSRTGSRSSILSKPTQLNDPAYAVGVIPGTMAMTAAEQKLPRCRLTVFNTLSDGYLAVQRGKIDAFAFDRHVLQFVARQNPDLAIMEEKVADEAIVIGAALDKTELMAKVNDFIRQYRADGAYQDMVRRWLQQENAKMPALPEAPSPAGTLVIGTAGLSQPMNYFKDGELTGFDIEFAKRLAFFLNVRLSFRTMEFSALVVAAASGKVDLLISNLNAMPERRKKILFSDVYVDSDIALLVRQDRLAAGSITTVSQLAGKKVGIITGSIFDTLIRKHVPQAELTFFDSFADELQALKTGKIASFFADRPSAQHVVASTSGVTYLKTPVATEKHAFAFALNRTKLRDEVDAVLRDMTQSGALREIEARWTGPDESAKILPNLELDGRNGVIRYATRTTAPPYSYIKDGKLAGYEVEIAQRIAERLGRRLEVSDMHFAAIIPSVTAGKYDMAGGNITVTEERAKSVLFSLPIAEVDVVVMVASGAEAVKTGFWPELVESFRRTFLVENRYRLVLHGLQVTLVITGFSALFGTLLGFGVCLMRRARSGWANTPAKVFIRTIQGTPIVLFLMILYYLVFGSVEIEAVVVAVIGFSINFAAYVSEMMRAGIEAVDRGQLEAAAALGFNRRQVFVRITFPQAARYALPVYKGELVSMLKMTAVVGYIAIQDLTKMSDIIRSRTYEAFFPLIATALIYFAAACAMVSLVALVEKRIDPKQRKRVVKGVTAS